MKKNVDLPKAECPNLLEIWKEKKNSMEDFWIKFSKTFEISNSDALSVSWAFVQGWRVQIVRVNLCLTYKATYTEAYFKTLWIQSALFLTGLSDFLVVFA